MTGTSASTRPVSPAELHELLNAEPGFEDAPTRLHRRATRAAASPSTPMTVARIQAPAPGSVHQARPASSVREDSRIKLAPEVATGRSRRGRLALWLLAGVVAAGALALGLARGETSPPTQAVAARATVESVSGQTGQSPTERSAQLLPEVQAEPLAAERLSSDEPATPPPDPSTVHAALDALAAGDPEQARDHYRAVAQETGEAVFAGIVEVLDRQIRCQREPEADPCH